MLYDLYGRTDPCFPGQVFQSLHKISYYPKASNWERGVFGKCYGGVMSSHIHVCIKALRTDNQLGSTFPVDAVLTSKLCHTNLPWLYRISEHGSHKLLVISFHGINNQSCENTKKNN